MLSCLLDRSLLSPSVCKENVTNALIAWFSGEAARLMHVDTATDDFRDALAVAIASLESRAAYYRSLLSTYQEENPSHVNTAPSLTGDTSSNSVGTSLEHSEAVSNKDSLDGALAMELSFSQFLGEH